MSRHGTASPVFEALIDVGLKDHDQAVGALERYARTLGVAGLSQWHAFDQISSEPHIQQLIAEAR
jgi:hypothetical protein